MKLVEMQGANPGAKRRRMAGVAAGVLALAGVFAAVTWLRSEPLVQAGPVAPVQAAPSRASALVTASPRRIGDHRAAARFLQFEPNRGQAPQAVRYLSRGPAHRVEIFDDGIALSAATPRSAGEGGADASAADASARLRFVGARSAVGFEAREPGPGQANYLVGDDASKWIRSVPGYRQLRRPELYPGIDLVYYSREGALEFDLVVKAGADPSRIRMHVGGARPPAIEASGDLLLDGAGGSLRLHRPVLYQNIAGEKKMLDARYVLRGERTLGFALPAYDKRYPLVIDPVFKLLYSTYLTGFHDDQVGALVLDAQSNAYVVGRTNSDDFVISGNAVQKGKSTTGLQYNIVLTKFDASGTLIYSTYLGGSGSDIATAIAVDAAGNAYVTGNTTSRDFPVTPGAQQPTFTGSLSAFLAVVSPDGSVLAHSTYYGGSGSVQATAIALDAGEAPVIAGFADTGLVTTPGAYKATLAAGDAAFVARFSAIAAGAPRLLAASYYGVDNPEANATAQGNHAFSMALDASGAPWLTGQAFTTNLPTTAAALQSAPAAMSPSCAPGPAPLNSFAFVARLSSDLGSLTYASYLTGATEPAGGAACSEFGHSLALDSSGNVYLTGATASAAFPTTAGAIQAAYPSAAGVASYTGFITKLKNDGSAILWSTYLGGNGGNTFPAVVALDPANAAVWTTSVTGGGSNYPVSVGAVQGTLGGGGADAGIAQLDAATGALKYSTFLGGASADVGLALAVDGGGNAFVAGNTFSPDFPLTANAFERAFRPDFYGGADWFFSILGQATIGAVKPERAGNTGDVSVSVRGAGIPSGSTCRLEGPVNIDAMTANAAADGTSLGCTLALDGQPAGDYAVVVVGPDGSRTRAAQRITVEAGTGGPEMWAGVVGRAKIRGGVPAPYEVAYGNRGSANAYGVALAISWPKGVTVTRKFEFTPLPPVPIADPTATAPEFTEKDGRVMLVLFLPMVQAGRTFTLPIEVTAPLTATDVRIEVALSRPLASSLDALRQAYAAASASDDGRLHAFARAKPEFTNLSDGQLCVIAAVNAAAAAVQTLPPARCISSAIALVLSGAQTAATNDNGNPLSVGNQFNYESFALSILQTVLTCALAANPLTAAIGSAAAAVNFLVSGAAAAEACGPTIAAAAIQIGAAIGIDPNDKSGPSGDGSAQHFAGPAPAAYQISFENLATAGLPAANVVVTDQIDGTKFDLSTVTLGSVAWGAYRIDVPPGLSSYATVYRIDATLSVRVQGSLNPSTGLLKWTFTTLDPATGLPPSDPTLGFLPPDTDGMKGQGHVNFVVAPKAGLAPGTVLQNQASIVFDANAAILTPTWIYTLDTAAPTSRVQSLAGKVGTTSFDVAWASPGDAGSAVRNYTVYVSDNGAAYTVWQSRVSTTSATYDGVSGHTYAFNVVATDGAGNVEPAKTSAEASIVVSGNFADSSSGSGGGCTIGADSQRDAVLPLIVLLAIASLVIGRRRERTRRRRAED